MLLLFVFFWAFFWLPKYAIGSWNFISKHLWPHVKSLYSKKRVKKNGVLKGLGEASSRGWRVSKACPPDHIPLPKFEADAWEGGGGIWWRWLCKGWVSCQWAMFNFCAGQGLWLHLGLALCLLQDDLPGLWWIVSTPALRLRVQSCWCGSGSLSQAWVMAPCHHQLLKSVSPSFSTAECCQSCQQVTTVTGARQNLVPKCSQDVVSFVDGLHGEIMSYKVALGVCIVSFETSMFPRQQAKKTQILFLWEGCEATGERWLSAAGCNAPCSKTRRCFGDRNLPPSSAEHWNMWLLKMVDWKYKSYIFFIRGFRADETQVIRSSGDSKASALRRKRQMWCWECCYCLLSWNCSMVWVGRILKPILFQPLPWDRGTFH